MKTLLFLLVLSVSAFAQGNYVIPSMQGSGQTALQPSINPGVTGSCPNWQYSTPIIATDAAHGNRVIQTLPTSESKRIVILGSSSARGVGASNCLLTSWAIQFRDAMVAKGYTVINASKEADNATALINRFFTDVAPLQPDFVILAGSIYNDGGPTAGNVNFHEQSVHRLIKMVEDIGAVPVIMGQFPNNGYTVAQYQMIEDLYMQWEKLGVQVWDFMSTSVDPTTGHYISQISSGDGVHPDDTGHSLMFQSIPLSYFDVARTQRATDFTQGNQSWQWGSDVTVMPLKVTPFPSLASFTSIAWIKDATGLGSALMSSDRDSINPLRIRSNSSTGVCELVDGGTTIAASTVSCSSGVWHHHAVSFNSGTNKAAYYIDGVLINSGTLNRSGLNTSNVTFLNRFDSPGGNCVGCQLAEPMVYRVSLQAQDIVSIYNGHPLRKSLEYYSTLGSTPGGAYAPNLADTGTQGTLGSATQWSLVGSFSASAVRSSTVVYAQSFGALANGVSNDSTPLNRALASGATTVDGGGKSYKISTSITVPAGVTLRNITLIAGTAGMNMVLVSSKSKVLDAKLIGTGTTNTIERGIYPAADGVYGVQLEVEVSNLTVGIQGQPVAGGAMPSQWQIKAFIHDIVGATGVSEGYGILLSPASECQIHLIATNIKRHALYLSAGAIRNSAWVSADTVFNYAVQLFSSSGQPSTEQNTIWLNVQNLSNAATQTGQSWALAVVQNTHRNRFYVNCDASGTPDGCVQVQGVGVTAGPFPTDNVLSVNATGTYAGIAVINVTDSDGTRIVDSTIKGHGSSAVINFSDTGGNLYTPKSAGSILNSSFDGVDSTTWGLQNNAARGGLVIQGNRIANTAQSVKDNTGTRSGFGKSFSKSITFTSLAAGATNTQSVTLPETFSSNVSAQVTITSVSSVATGLSAFVSASTSTSLTVAVANGSGVAQTFTVQVFVTSD